VTDLRLARFQELLVVNSDPAISVARDRSPCVPFVSCHQYIDVRSFSINIQNPSKLQIDLRQDQRRKRLRVNRGRDIGAPLGTTSHSARLDALRHVPPRSQISLLMADQTNRDRTTRCERARLVLTIEGTWPVASRYRPASIRDELLLSKPLWSRSAAFHAVAPRSRSQTIHRARQPEVGGALHQQPSAIASDGCPGRKMGSIENRQRRHRKYGSDCVRPAIVVAARPIRNTPKGSRTASRTVVVAVNRDCDPIGRIRLRFSCLDPSQHQEPATGRNRSRPTRR
jgi:hypothetical protein